ncbi:MAG: DMT family transporter [archaeon]
MLKSLLKKGPIFIIFAAFLWSLDGLLRRNLYSLDPLIVVLYEHIFGAIILLPVFLISFKELSKLNGKQWFSVFWVSLLGGLAGTFLYTTALSKVGYIEFSVVVLLQQVQPIFAISMAAIFLKEKIGKNFVFWALIAFIGVYLVSFRDLIINIDTGKETIIAALMALGAAFAWGSSTVFGRMGLLKLSSAQMSSLRFILTSIITFIFITFSGKNASIYSMSYSQLLTIIFITFSTGMVAVLIYYYGLKRTEAKVSTICEMFWPVSAIALDFFYYNKVLAFTQVIGALILLISIFQVSRMKKN